MIKVLIADDEKWVRAIIKDVILSSNETAYVISGEASDGQEALELCLNLAPDILITDIRMPELDGLNLISKVKKLIPNLKIIIISGYDEFEYAQSALKLGAFDYLLKPIEENMLLEVMSYAKKVICEERQKQEADELLKIQHEAGFTLLREKFLTDILKGTPMSLDQIKKRSKHLGIVLAKPVFGVITFSVDDYTSKISDLSKPQKFSFVSKFKDLLNKVSKRYLNGYCLYNPIEENEIVIIYNVDNTLSNDYISSVFTIIQKLAKRHFNITCSVGVSSQVNCINKVHTLYQEANKAIKYKMIYGLGSILFYENVRNIKTKETTLSKDLVEEVTLNLKLRNNLNISKILDDVFVQLNSYKESTPEFIKNTLWKFMLDVTAKLDCKGSIESHLYEFNQTSVYEEFKKLETLEDTNSYLKKFFKDIINNYISNEPINNNTIDTAKKFIDANYSKDITLELISNYVYLNSSYFSELFKKETGKNFIEYLTNLRMKHAKELLLNTELKTYEVCEAVGYTDSKYFSKLFKKIVGLNPSEYKGNL